MSTINTNTSSMVARRNLQVSQSALALSLERLSSGLRINRGADDPAGLIVSERLRTEILAVNQAVDNSNRAINVIATTEGALNEVSSLLIDIQALVIEAANSGAFSDEEIAANQLQIDSAIDSITRIANTTSFAGRKLLNGELDYVTSGVVATQLADVNVLSVKFGSNAYIPVNVVVTTSAQQALLTYPTSALPDGGSPVTITLGGKDGIVTLTFPASATSNDMAAAINGQTDATGVTASAIQLGGNLDLALISEGYGTSAFVTVDTLPGSAPFIVQDRDGDSVRRTGGRDAVATVNGASTIADGLELKLASSLLKLELTIDATFGTGTSSFAITGGGALFQLGPRVNTNLQENIGVKAMHAERLGNSLVGYLSQLKTGEAYSLRSKQFKQASDIIDAVITDVAVLRGRLGAFERNTLQTNIRQLQITAENLTASESVIRDTDFAAETSELMRAQILVQAGNSILAIANAHSPRTCCSCSADRAV